MEAVPSFLDYGALGFVVVIVIIIAVGARLIWVAINKRLDDAAEFSRQVATRALTRSEVVQDKMMTIMSETTKQNEQNCSVLSAAVAEMKAAREETAKEHERMIALLSAMERSLPRT